MGQGICEDCGQNGQHNEHCPRLKEDVSKSASVTGLEGPAIDMDSVEHFICWLIDHCERDIISEEGLQRAYANFLTWHKKNKQKAD